jgi:hypothetical protein
VRDGLGVGVDVLIKEFEVCVGCWQPNGTVWKDPSFAKQIHLNSFFFELRFGGFFVDLLNGFE